MGRSYFQFKQFLINQDQTGMKVTTDACLFGAWVAEQEKNASIKRVLDIGTGTGLLTLMLAQKIDAQFDAVEMNQSAFGQAVENFKQSPWDDRIRANQVAIQDFRPDHSYDLIICNPPFFTGNEKGKSSNKNQAVHADTLPMKDLVGAAERMLRPEGRFYVMYPEHELKEFERTSTGVLSIDHFLNIRNLPPGNVFRCVGAFLKEEEAGVKRSHISIRETDGLYSKDFQNLLADFYL